MLSVLPLVLSSPHWHSGERRRYYRMGKAAEHPQLQEEKGILLTRIGCRIEATHYNICLSTSCSGLPQLSRAPPPQPELHAQLV
jgi:Ni,Fe-hydrogenase I small subunit